MRFVAIHVYKFYKIQLKSNIGSLFTLPWEDMFDEEMYDESDAESCCSDPSPVWEHFDFAEEDEINIQMTTARMH